MGCCSSSYVEGEKLNFTLNGYYGGHLEHQRQNSKRSFSSRISNGSSSGVSSACTSPSRRSIFSRRKTNSPSARKTKGKTHIFSLSDVPVKGIDMIEICDDFGEAAHGCQQNNQSCGYYTESMSNGSGASSSTTDLQKCVRTQDTSGLGLESAEPESILPPSPSDLEMEMYMMYNSPCLMPKTSSPIFQRRDVTYDAIALASPPSRSFQKWSNYLQKTPAYMLNNISRIPEAIAGHFSPIDHPAYTDLEDMESAAKRYKVDLHMSYESQADTKEDAVFQQRQMAIPASLTHTICTDL